MKIALSQKIYLAKSILPNAGRGLFAAMNIKKGEIIEKCPVIEIPENQVELLRKTKLIDYYFRWGKNDKQVVIALGFGSLYNHSNQPNAEFKANEKEEIIDFIALTEINKDEEITINYNFANPDEKGHEWIKKI